MAVQFFMTQSVLPVWLKIVPENALSFPEGDITAMASVLNISELAVLGRFQ